MFVISTPACRQAGSEERDALSVVEVSDEKSQNNEIPPHTSFGMTTIINFKYLIN